MLKGTKRLLPDYPEVNVPIKDYKNVDSMLYIHFASYALPKRNPGLVLNETTTNLAWYALLDYLFAIRQGTPQKVLREARQQV